MARLTLLSPLAGWALPIEDVPDPVFAQRMVGDGVGIDPTSSELCAPCAGRVFPIAGASHALSLRPVEGGEILLHLGIDTVKLGGAGFQSLVGEGESVVAGQPLLRFDLDLIARRAPSAVTPVLLPAGGRILRRATQQLLAVGDFLMEVEFDAVTGAVDAGDGEVLRRTLRIPFEHGLHARPAAQLGWTLRQFGHASVRLRAAKGEVDACSTTALMALGTHQGDEVELIARGREAQAALDAVAMLFEAERKPARAKPSSPHAPASVMPRAEAAPGQIAGVIASRGLAVGPVHLLPKMEFQFAATSADPEREHADLQEAIFDVHASFGGAEFGDDDPGESVLAAQREFLVDRALLDAAHAHIRGGASAPAAWRRAIDEAAHVLAGLEDARMRERVADLRDVERRVLAQLTGQGDARFDQLPEQAILVVDDLLPSELLGMRERIAGLCMARGGSTSHVALIASAMNLPALVALGPEVLNVRKGSVVLLDAERGLLSLSPSPEALEAIEMERLARQRRAAEDLLAAAAPGHTRDGIHVAVNANLGAASETGGAIERGADGCGLLRTEFLFLERDTAPSEDEQFAQYRAIADQLAPRPLTIRTMDIGGDKPIPYLPLPPEENPALGLRGLRTSLAFPTLMRAQLRAILRLRSPQVRILLPMVNDLGELRAARALLRECADELDIVDLPPLGAMIETPASALLATQLLREADFLSIGTNDLSQYTLAIDRGHPELSAKLDALHPAVLRLIGSVAAAGESRGREVAVCGGLASDPEAVALLVGLGIRELSAVPNTIPTQKRILRGLDAANCRELARRALELEDAGAVRALVASWPGASQQVEVQP